MTNISFQGGLLSFSTSTACWISASMTTAAGLSSNDVPSQMDRIDSFAALTSPRATSQRGDSGRNGIVTSCIRQKSSCNASGKRKLKVEL